MFRSAAFKLTLWYLTLIMLVSALFSIALYRVSDDQLSRNLDRQRGVIGRLQPQFGFGPQGYNWDDALNQQLADSEHQLWLRLLFLNLITLLVGGGASYYLARRTLRPIQDAMEAQGRFTADASHELRTPLTCMRTEIEVALRSGKLTAAEARQLLQSNLEEIGKLEVLSAGLLRLAQSNGELKADAVTNMPAREVLEEAAGRFRKAAEEKDMKLSIESGSETVACDRDSLIELIAILLDNAIKYSPRGSKVRLGSRVEGANVLIAVADQGSGIKSTDLPHIFERFYRADRSRSKEQIPGYGLGLSIAKRIADMHHGSISVTSTPGRGSTFIVKLPARFAPKRSIV